MKRFVIFTALAITFFSTSQLYALDSCECQVNGPNKYSGSSDAQCSLLYHIANQSSEDCSVITFESGMSGTIKLGSGFPLNSNYLRIVGPVDSNGNPKITLVADNIPTEYFIRLMGTHTNKLPTLENFYIQAPGKKAIYIDGSEHILKNVRVSDSKIGVEIVGNENRITSSGNKFYNNGEAGIKIIKGDYNYISQAVFYGNKIAITRTKATTSSKDNDFGNSAFTFKRAKDIAVVGLLSSGVKNPVGVTGFADKDLDTGIDGLELFEADNQDEKEDMGQGKKYIIKKNSSSWAFGMPDGSDANFRRFGVAVANIAADRYYTATSIADKTDEDETTEFSSTFSAEDEMIIGGPDCLDPAKDNAWYLFAIDGYDNEGDDAACYKMNGQAMVGITCTSDPWNVDSDNDGMPNGLEDKDFDCFVDNGETDPDNQDTVCKLFPTLPECDDADEDDIPDIDDNCPLKANTDQKHSDDDSLGDVCDNCPEDANQNQNDGDNDNYGDVCDNCEGVIGDVCKEGVTDEDNDWDDDGILNDADNCPHTPNTGQEDTDKDGVGDVCDNCQYNKNPDQTADADEDGVGDVCEGDNDSDGIINDDDNCIDDPNFYQENIDSDIYGDVCDNCADDGNDDQKDSDSDGAGDICDNCIAAPNSGQDDLDSDAIGDVCDIDMDGDGIPDIGDNCPSVYNKDQADSDADGIGDRCDLDPSISPDIDQGPLPSIFGDIEGGGGHVSSRGGCSSDIGSVAAGGTPNLLVSIILLVGPLIGVAAFRLRQVK